ncbi:Zn(2+)-responsive transcriptional regulator [Leucothrix sargassi]|nr:Zn(2+)-responsive transcriptional regulator [Leucothrix sargassi]
MRIGELSKKCNIPVETIRYYEKEGLIPAPPRQTSGYRDYPESSLSFLHFIQSAKAVGFSLNECRDLLSIFVSRDSHTCQEVKALSEQKLADLKSQMEGLARMHQTLKAISDACCGGHESAANCAILNTLEGGDE